ncbi:MAG TPA: hypothetical protein VFM56_11845 [Solimonas sp.]|nr:hypothetical protein [Solimonas sp.]
MNRHITVVALRAGLSAAALLLGACHGWLKPAAGDTVAATLPAPDAACRVALHTPAPVLSLPGTDAPRRAARNDDDVDIAQIHTVNRPLQEIGVWNDQADGWSVLALTVGSKRARSIAVRLHGVRLPEHSALWLCSADGERHQGPYTEAPNGELWTASVASAQARIEVWTPTATRNEFSADLTDVYGGYQP